VAGAQHPHSGAAHGIAGSRLEAPSTRDGGDDEIVGESVTGMDGEELQPPNTKITIAKAICWVGNSQRVAGFFVSRFPFSGLGLTHAPLLHTLPTVATSSSSSNGFLR